MQKTEFIQKLTEILRDANLPENEIEASVTAMNDYLDTLSPEALAKEINELSNVERVAQVILSRKNSRSPSASSAPSGSPKKRPRRAMATPPRANVKEAENADSTVATEEIVTESSLPAEPATAPEEATEASERVSTANADETPLSENVTSTTEKAEQATSESNEAVPVPGAEEDTSDIIIPVRRKKRPLLEENGATIKIDPIKTTERASTSRGNTVSQTATLPLAHTSANIPVAASEPVETQVALRSGNAIKYSDLDKLVTVSPTNRIIFWLVFLLLLPLILALLVSVATAFLVLLLGLACIIAACIGVLIAVVGAGTGISLFGLIYGTTQLFTTLPAGLYEIGLAVTVAGGALFVGIILYNMAIRLIPFLMKYLYRFFFFLMKKGYQLFRFIRRECTGK